MIFIPEGFAHGYQTLEDGTELFYQMSTPFRPDASCGVRWDDPDIGIGWPTPDSPILSERDRSFPRLMEAAC